MRDRGSSLRADGKGETMNQPKTEPAQASVTGCVYIGAPTGQILPCKSSCPKCGSTDIFRKHLDGGEEARPGLSSGAGRSSVFVDRSTSWWKAKIECLTHYCRTCQYYWDSACLSKSDEGERKTP
jgi:hypothetical protein